MKYWKKWLQEILLNGYGHIIDGNKHLFFKISELSLTSLGDK